MKKHLHWLIPAAALFLLVWMIYYPVATFQFIQWDDDYNVYDNPLFKEGLLLPFWETWYMGLYIPLVYTVWSGLYHLTSSPEPLVFHVFNVQLHIINSYLVFIFIKRVLAYFKPEQEKSWIMALTGAILFAIHPLQIGGVAWVSGGRDLMSVFFVLCSMILYFSRETWKDAILSFVFFCLALLCKPGAVSLPALFVLFDIMLKRRWFITIPFFITAFTFIPLTKSAQSVYMVGMTHQEWYYRPIIALDAIGFYLSKLFFPMTLAVDYGRLPGRVISQQLFWPYLIIALVGFVGVYLLLRKQRATLIGVAIVALSLAPVLGLIPFNFQRISTVTDHYMYLPMIGVALVLSLFSSTHWNWKFHVPLAAFFIMIAIFGTQRIPVWEEHMVFFNDMKAKNPMSHSAYIMLGDRYFRNGNVAKAEEEFFGAIKADPMSAVAAGNIGYVLVYQGKFQKALESVKRFIDNADFDYINQVHPHTIGMVYLSYGTALWKMGNPSEGFARLCQVFKYKPRDIDARSSFTAMQTIKNENPNLKLECPYVKLP